MDDFLTIQNAFFCENCRECGARPVIEQVKSLFVVRCPNSDKHYKTKPGPYIQPNIDEWNMKNRANVPVVSVKPPSQKAS